MHPNPRRAGLVAMGTRFLASTEMAISQNWKQRIVAADALDAVKVPNSEPAIGTYNRPGVPPVQPRSLRTSLTDALTDDPDSVDPAEVGPRLLAAVARGHGDEYLPFTGQSAGLIHDIRPAAEIIRTVLTETLVALHVSQPQAAPLGWQALATSPARVGRS